MNRRQKTFGVLSVVMLLVSAAGVLAQGGKWYFPPLPMARQSLHAAAIGAQLFVVGGYSPASGDIATFEAYNAVTSAWTTLPPLPLIDGGTSGRYGGTLDVIQGDLYLAGGWRTSPPLPTSSLLIYDPGTNAWSTGASMPTLSADSCGAVIGGKLYVLTGADGFSYTSRLDMYDPVTNTWQGKASAPQIHVACTARAVSGKLYVVGGYDGAAASSRLDVYDAATNTWSTESSMPTSRYGAAGALIDGQLYVIGGSDGSANLNNVEAYDPLTDTWQTLTPMPRSRSFLAAGAFAGRLLAVGGSLTTGVTDIVELFVPPALP